MSGARAGADGGSEFTVSTLLTKMKVFPLPYTYMPFRPQSANQYKSNFRASQSKVYSSALLRMTSAMQRPI